MKSYDFKQVSLIFGGRQITGFAEGTAIDVVRDADAFALTVGADGESMRSKSNNKSGTVTFRLLQTSESNRILSELALADENGVGGPVPMLIKDGSGSDLHADDQAYIQKIAQASYGAEANEREWVIRCPSLNTFLGGN